MPGCRRDGSGAPINRNRSALPWRAISGYGDPSDLVERTVSIPAKYRERYTVTARGRLMPDPFAVDGVTVRDHDTGAVLTFADAGWSIAGNRYETKPAELGDLWRDARYLAGWARSARGGGRPSQRSDRIAAYRAAILALQNAGYSDGKITARLILERLSRTGDDSQLRADVGPWLTFRTRVLRGE